MGLGMMLQNYYGRGPAVKANLKRKRNANNCENHEIVSYLLGQSHQNRHAIKPGDMPDTQIDEPRSDDMNYSVAPRLGHCFFNR